MIFSGLVSEKTRASGFGRRGAKLHVLPIHPVERRVFSLIAVR
jgi:hypothetical protein